MILLIVPRDDASTPGALRRFHLFATGAISVSFFCRLK
jgi:hypothetical protein